jgi:hypothetical protein
VSYAEQRARGDEGNRGASPMPPSSDEDSPPTTPKDKGPRLAKVQPTLARAGQEPRRDRPKKGSQSEGSTEAFSGKTHDFAPTLTKVFMGTMTVTQRWQAHPLRNQGEPAYQPSTR